MANPGKKLKIFSLPNVILALAIIFVLLMLFAPNFKNGVIQGIMKIGFFQPKLERTHISSPLAAGNSQPIAFINAQRDTLHLSQLKGKVVFFNVWATWCGPCKAELPSIAALKKNLEKNPNIEFITIDRDGNPKNAQHFLNSRNLSLTVWAFLENKPEFLRSKAIPFTVILDKEGYIAFQHMGIADYNSKKFIQFIENLTKE